MRAYHAAMPFALFARWLDRARGSSEPPAATGRPPDPAPNAEAEAEREHAPAPAPDAEREPEPTGAPEPEPESDAEPPPPAPDPLLADPAVDAREKRLAEWLLEDERLRGDLDDDTWQPIQDWLLVEARRLAAETAGLSEEQADAALARAREDLRGAAFTLVDAAAPRSEDAAA